jgi:queuine tRNA-ribosyltransferase
LDETGGVWVDQVYTKAYLRHLVKSGEYLGIQIATIHNLAFYLELVKQAREHIAAGDFMAWKNEVSPKLSLRR